MHRQQSNCIRMAFVRRLPMRPIVHVQMLVTFDERMWILWLMRRRRRQQRRLRVRIVYSPSDIFQLDAVLMSNPYKMDHGIRRANQRHLWWPAFSFDLHNSSMDSLRRLLALHDAVTLMHWLSSSPLDMANQHRMHRKMVAPSMLM